MPGTLKTLRSAYCTGSKLLPARRRRGRGPRRWRRGRRRRPGRLRPMLQEVHAVGDVQVAGDRPLHVLRRPLGRLDRGRLPADVAHLVVGQARGPRQLGRQRREHGATAIRPLRADLARVAGIAIVGVARFGRSAIGQHRPDQLGAHPALHNPAAVALDGPVIGRHLPRHDRLAQPPVRLDHQPPPVPGDRVERERHPGRPRVHQLEHADREVMGAQRARPAEPAAVIERVRRVPAGPALRDVAEHLVGAGHAQVGLVLPGEAGRVPVLAHRRRPDRDPQPRPPPGASLQPRLRVRDRVRQPRRQRLALDQLPRLFRQPRQPLVSAAVGPRADRGRRARRGRGEQPVQLGQRRRRQPALERGGRDRVPVGYPPAGRRQLPQPRHLRPDPGRV